MRHTGLAIAGGGLAGSPAPLRPVGAGDGGAVRYEALDLLRLLAVLAVAAFHYGFAGPAAGHLEQLSLPAARYAYLGVQLFFTISGFVIACSADGKTAAGFAVARAARLYPGFLVCMTITFLVTVAFGAPRLTADLAQWSANLLVVAPAFRQPYLDGAYWSIVYELVFYAWICVLIRFGLFRRRIAPILLAWLVLSLANQLLIGSDVLRRILLTDQSGFFAAGMLLYELRTGRRGASLQILLAFAAGCAVLQALSHLDWLRARYLTEFDGGIIAGLSLAAIGAVTAAVRVRRLPLPSGAVVAAGGLTYPLYLLHQHIGYIAFDRLGHGAAPVVLVPAVLALLIAAAWAIWRYVERPGQRLAGRLLAQAVGRIGPMTNAPGGRHFGLRTFRP